MRKILKHALPVDSKRRKLARAARQRLRKNKVLRTAYGAVRNKIYGLPGLPPDAIITYAQWVQNCEPILWTAKQTHKAQPLISLVVPAYNTPERYLKPLLDSILAQTYSNWQLCVADGSTSQEYAEVIEKVCKQDERIDYKRLTTNHGIVGNTNEAFTMVKGTFVAFLDHDDSLAPQALYEVIDALNKAPKTDIFYSDEDKVSDDGSERSLPFFKPGWSPAMEEGVNYMTHFLVVRKTVLDKVGLLRDGFEGAQDYDLILRLTDYTKNIVHIPKILYHWRLAAGSTSGPIENKGYADEAGQRALQEHVEREKISAKVLRIPELPTNFRLQYMVPKDAKVSIIIPFKDKPELLKTCLKSIFGKTTFKNYEIILLSNNSTEKATHDYLASLKDHPKIQIFYWDHPFNYAALNNFGRKQASGDYLVMLNNDTEVITPHWLEELVGMASQPGVGAVGPLLFYPNNKIQHAGIVLGMKVMAGHVFRMLPEDALSAFGRPYWPRNYLAVTGACLAIKTSKYDEVGGLNEGFIMAGNDVSFCISLYEKGYLNVYWPFAKLYHYENMSVGSYQNAPEGDYELSLHYYRPYLDWKDPYFNPNLDLMNEQIALRSSYE